jgi:hypothetical protein
MPDLEDTLQLIHSALVDAELHAWKVAGDDATDSAEFAALAAVYCEIGDALWSGALTLVGGDGG